LAGRCGTDAVRAIIPLRKGSGSRTFGMGGVTLSGAGAQCGASVGQAPALIPVGLRISTARTYHGATTFAALERDVHDARRTMADLEELAVKRDRGYLLRLILMLAVGAVVSVFLWAGLTGDRVSTCVADVFLGGAGK